MRVWADIYDTDDNRLGQGPVFNIRQAQVKRALDGGGSLRATLFASDPRALELIAVGRIVKLWGEDVSGAIRLYGEGLIAKMRITDDPTGAAMTIDGPDLLEDLKRKNTLLARIYNQERIEDVCEGLIGLVPGWAVAVDSSIADEIVDVRFDGVSILKAFQTLAKNYGYHIRASLTSSRTLEFGAFGVSNGLRVQKVEVVSSAALRNPTLLMVQRMSQDRVLESNNYFNVIIPMGAGEGTAAVTLLYSTRTSPYPIQTMTGPDGLTLYYLSTTNYPSGGHTNFVTDGEAVVRVGQFKDISPLSNSEADFRNAANALYDAAVEELVRGSLVQEVYNVTVKNAQTSIAPGDTVHVHYVGQVDVNGVPVTYLNVRDDFYVLEATEVINLDGSDVQLEISNLDKRVIDAMEKLYNDIDQIELRTKKPNPGGSLASYVYDREIAPTFPAEVPIDITDAVVELLRVRMRIKTSPFRSTVSSAVAASGGGSAPTSSGGGATTETSAPVSLSSGLMIPLGGDHRHDIASHTHDVTLPNHTHTVTISPHTHDVTLDFVISDDTETPEVITVWYAGVDVTMDLFAAATLAPSGGEINVLADAGVLADMLRDAAGGLRQLHTIEIRCASGQGRVEVTIERFETTQTIRLGV